MGVLAHGEISYEQVDQQSLCNIGTNNILDSGFISEQDYEQSLHNIANKRAYAKQPTKAQQLGSPALHDGVFAEQGDQQRQCNIANKIVDVHDDQMFINGRVGSHHEQILGCHENHDARPCHGINMCDEFLQI